MSATVLPDSVQTVPEALAFWAERTPHAVALLAPDRAPMTYQDLHQAVARLAASLRGRGLGRHDGIALLVPEGRELCLALLAAITVGIAVPLPWPNPEPEYGAILRHRRVRAALATEQVRPLASASLASEPPLLTVMPGAFGRGDELCLNGPVLDRTSPSSPPTGIDIALILQSSGTTGRPKLIPRLHRNSVATCRAIIAARALTPADRCLNLSRVAYSQGFILLTTAIFSGGSLVSLSTEDAGELPRWLTTYRPTFISTTPAVLRTIAVERAELRAALDRSPLRFVLSSAGPLTSAELASLERTLRAPILNTYGMSEASFIAGEPFPEIHRVPGAVGLARCEVRIVDDGLHDVKTGASGEIVVRGPRVFPGYLDDPEANAAAFLPGGWFRTGDVGFLDDEGYLHLCERLGEVINRGGDKIVPHELEGVLLAHPDVAEAAVIGVPDARLGEDIAAAVVLRPGADANARVLRRWMLDRLSAHKVPRRIWLVDALPRTPTGKVRRGELARRWREHGP